MTLPEPPDDGKCSSPMNGFARSKCLRRVLLVCMALAAPIALPWAARAQSASEQISTYDVDLTIQSDGSLDVVERIAYDFGPEPHHGIVRVIPVRVTFDNRNDRIYPLKVLSVVGSPGTPTGYKVQTSGNDLQIKIGDANKTVTGVHTYTINYRVQGALNGFPDHDELY